MMRDPDFLYKTYDIVLLCCAILIFFLAFFGFLKPKIPVFFAILLCVFAVLVMGFIPFDSAIATDRSRYISLFLFGDVRNITDSGFLLFVSLFSRLLGSNYIAFFLIVALIYVSGYYAFSKSICPKVFLPILLIGVLGSNGFLSYNVNTMRSGLGLSVFLMGVASFFSDKKKLAMVFFFLSGCFHFSLFALVGAFFLSRMNVSIKWLYAFWFFCLILSVINVASPLTDLIETLENEKMMKYMTDEDSSYRTGFRIDFIVYSMIPIIIGGWFILKKKFIENKYLSIYRLYLITNAIWLLFIRIPYTDRVAYLSWFLFPYILILPTLDKKIHPVYLGGVFSLLSLISIVL